MSLEEAVPTLEELQAAKIEQLVTGADPSCWAYAMSLLDPKTLPAAGSSGWKARTLVGFVTSLKLDTDSDAEPFKLGTWFGELGASNLSGEQLNVLAAWLPEVTDPELRARIADVLWMTQRPRNHLTGRAALTAYLEAAERHLAADGHWPHATDAYARALALPSAFRPADLTSRMQAVLDGFFGLAGGPRDARLMHLMLDHDIGDAAKNAPLAEAEAERRERDAEAETYATNLSLMLSRESWAAAARWRTRELGANAPAALAAKLREAETHVKEADKARDACQPLVEAHFLSNAISALQRAGEERSRIDALVSRMMAAQRGAPFASVSTTSIDLTDQVAGGRAAVSNKPLHEALFELARVTQSPRISTLRAMTMDHLSKSVSARLFPAAISSSDSRVVAHMPPVSIGEDGEVKDEAVLRWHMWNQAQWIRMMSCGRIMGARDQLVLEHNPRIADLLPLMNVSALVPSGHERLFAKGLHAGLHGDFAVAIHILLPQLENGLRAFIEEALGRPMVKHHDDGTQSVNLFRRVLTHPDLAKILGDDLLFDLQGLLIEEAATNLRNRMSHGLLGDREVGFDAMYAWWMCLRLCMMLRPARREDEPPRPPSPAEGTPAPAGAASAPDEGAPTAVAEPGPTTTVSFDEWVSSPEPSKIGTDGGV